VKRSKVRIVFPDTPINGRPKHAHHHDGTHGCTDHFHIEDHRESCVHEHNGVGHLISLDAECGFVRDESGVIRAMNG